MIRNTKFAVTAAILSMICVQGGASFAKQLFPAIGPIATTALRIGLSAIILYLITRPKLYTFTKQQWLYCSAYGLGIAVMNLIFYMAIQRIPLGLGVTIEFVGPLFLAFALSRKLLDVVWAALACAGILLIVPWQSNGVDPLGLLFALLAGTFWAVYILMGSKVSRIMEGRQAVSAGMIIATLFILPIALWDGAILHLNLSLFGKGLLVAILSSALPFSLDMMALGKLPTKTFSILTSLQPAFAALSGLVFLHEVLTVTQWLSVACVVLASIGTTVFSKRDGQTPKNQEVQ
ncbi:DMT family transporter [Sphingobacterium daejeonense]|uniref:DMT family transporter n=1 Tax=Sphingobacterium daejeonense TaxID=371142 RepID=A0ABW3RNY7_9SPHI